MDTATNPNVSNNPMSNNKNVIITGVIIVVVLLLFVGVLGFSKKSNNTQNQVNPTAMPLPKESAVSLTASGFEPQTVTIQAGGAVRWTNNSNKSATVNSDDHPTHRKFPELNLGEFSNGSTLVHIFTKPGTYTYHNHFSPDQKGTVIVQ